MKKVFKSFTAIFLTMIMAFSSVVNVAAETTTDGENKIVSTDMDLDSSKNNVENYYYSEDELKEEYPDGMFVVEYNSYGIYEGGTDPENPEDVYLGIVVYRLGGNSQASTVTFSVTGISVDSELYPDSLGTVEFEPQQDKAIAKIKITNDDVRNGDQIMMFALVEATTGLISDASSALITVTDDEPYVQSVVSMSCENIVTDKNEGFVSVKVSRKNNDTDYCTFVLKTSDGTAKAGVDYQAIEQEVMFSPGQTEQIINIPLVQSDEIFTDTKYFSLELTDLKGCEAEGETSIRLDITNKEITNSATKLTSVDNNNSDLTVDESTALTDSSVSVINVNDNLDRKEILMSVIGAANGTSVQAVPDVQLVEASNKWESTLKISAGSFKEVYHTGEHWYADMEYSDGNENLLLFSYDEYNLNYFDSVILSFENDRWGLNGYPNTAFGYLTDKGNFDAENDDSDVFSFKKYDLTNCSQSEMNDMDKAEFYYLRNWNNQDVFQKDIKNPISFSKSDGTRYPGTTGIEAEAQTLFYMLYDDEGWDDHHFDLGTTELVRTIIPFSVFESDNVSNFVANKDSVEFDQDGYHWKISVNNTNKGGVGQITDDEKIENKNRYGFYVGSELKVTFNVLSSAGANVPTPEHLFFKDSNGNIHNSTKINSDNYFVINFETLMCNNTSTLQKDYFMTQTQAEDHINNTLGEGESICSSFKGKLCFNFTYTIKQGIKIDYKNIDVLKNAIQDGDGNLETDEQHEERVLTTLDGFITYYLNGEDITPEPVVNLVEGIVSYPEIKFDYIKVAPEYVGVGTVASSNLFDQDFASFKDTQQISNEICSQVDTDVIFTIYSEDVKYVEPRVTLVSTSVSSLVDNEYKTVYNANNLDDYIPFESLYQDTSENPEVTYYTVRFVISDIYLSGMEKGEEKDYTVSVNYVETDGSPEKSLFTFNYIGGATFIGSQKVELNIKDGLYDTTNLPDDINTDIFTPVLELVDYTANGYEYVMYLPTCYNYHIENDKSSNEAQIFKGNDGINIKVNDYNKNHDANISEDNTDSEETTEIIATLDIADTQYVCIAVPTGDTEADGQSAESVYNEAQEEFYTYTDHNASVGVSGINVDFTNFSTMFAKSLKLAASTATGETKDIYNKKAEKFLFFKGTGGYVKINDNQIVAGLKLSLTADYRDKNSSDTPTLFGNAAKGKSVSNITQVTNGYYGAVGMTGVIDVNVQFDYSEVTHQYRFSRLNANLSNISFFATVSIPIPPTLNLVYLSFSTNVSLTTTTGFCQVLNYVDSEGKCHYKTLWNGIPLKIGFYASLGFGVGISGILAFEASGAIDTSVTFGFGKTTFVATQQEFDFNANNTNNKDYGYSTSYSGQWKNQDVSGLSFDGQDYKDYCYNDTLCVSSNVGDKLVISAKGTSFQLVGVKDSNGGKMEVTVRDSDGAILKSSTVNMCSATTSLYKTIFHWEVNENYTTDDEIDFTVTITHLQGDNEGTSTINLDSMRIYNPSYADKTEYEEATFDNFYFKLSLALKFVIGPFDIILEPAYLQTKMTSTNVSFVIGTLDKILYSESVDIKSSNEDLPVVLTSNLRSTSLTDSNYFDTGEYSEFKTKTLLMDNISNTAKTQVINHNNNIYSFYTVLTEDKNSYYQLYYSINGINKGLVTDDIFVSNFNAFEDSDGTLKVEMITADSTIASISKSDGVGVLNLTDGSLIEIKDQSNLSEVVKRTCVKVASFDDNQNAFIKDNIQIVGSTDGNGLQESLPVTATTADIKNNTKSKNSVLFFVEDTKTDDPANYNMNWTSFDEEDSKTSQNVEEIMNAVYSGRSQVYYSVLKSDGTYSSPVAIDAFEELSDLEKKPGFKITSIDALMADDSNICLAYSVEIPYVRDNNGVGTLKEIYYRRGEFVTDENGNTTIDFGDKIVVDSVLDYDKDLDEIFSDVTQLSSKHYNSNSGELYESNILRNVQLENAMLCENGDTPSVSHTEPCLFYQTNATINYVTYSTLSQVETAKENDSDETFNVKMLYNNTFDDYEIAVTPEGDITLIYCDNSESGSYVDTLYIVDYDTDNHMWNKPRKLTCSDAFNQSDFDNRDFTASVAFEQFSAFVNQNKVSVALKSSYIPFSYEYGTTTSMVDKDFDVDISEYYDATYVDKNGSIQEAMITPILDYDSDYARSDIFLITFEQKVTDVDVTNFELNNKIFVDGETIEAYFEINNTGDCIINNMNVSLYYQSLSNDSSSKQLLVTKELSGYFLAGDSTSIYLDFVVGEGLSAEEKQIYSKNTIFGVVITSGRDILYDSYTDSTDSNKTYYLINPASEIIFNSTDVNIDSEGIMTFSVNVANIGNKDAENNVTVYCKAYEALDENAENKYIGTMFAFNISADKLTAGAEYLTTNTFNVNNYLQNDANLYYNFEISTNDVQYDTDNDIMNILCCQQIPEIEVQSIRYSSEKNNLTAANTDGIRYSSEKNNLTAANTDGIRIFNLNLGDEIEIANNIISNSYNNSSIRAYEIGSDCLSIDNSAEDGTVKIKVVKLPEDNNGYVKLLINIKGTVIYKYFYLNISNTNFIDFNKSNSDNKWTLSKDIYVYATNNNTLSTETDGSEIEFKFYGKDLRIYGDYLKNGGCFDLTVTDADGKIVANKTIDTVADLNDYGMLMYKSKDLGFGEYTVNIKAKLDEGEILTLDYAKFTIDTSDANTEPYAVVNSYDEELDAPLINGRQRQARFTLTFDKDIELAEGKNLEDITLTFNEYEKGADGKYTATENTVTFTASEITDGKNLVLTSTLSSKQGSILKYVLADSKLPDGCLVSSNGKDIDTAIPNYDMVSYELKESGILSVTVADDDMMPDGSVHKSVEVKFMTAPDTSRLEGTKLLYTTTDTNGQESIIEFEYVQMTDDPRIAVYRADKLELDSNEMSKTFSFNEGIVLNENNYVLITAQGDYLDNDISTIITDKSKLDIVYNKVKAESADIQILADKISYIPKVYIDFEQNVDISDVIENKNAYVVVNETITDVNSNMTTNEYILTVNEVINNGKTVVFSGDNIALNSGTTILYTLKSDEILYTDDSHVITCAYDGIAVDPTLEDVEELSFNTSAYIVNAEPYFEDGTFKNSDNVLCVDVKFNTEVNESDLEGTTLNVEQYITEYDFEYSNTLTLQLDSVKTDNTADGDNYTTATYKYISDDDEISLTRDEISKTFVVDSKITVAEDKTITTLNGNIVCSVNILNKENLTVKRAEAQSAEIKLVENGDMGYNVELDVKYNEDITLCTEGNIFVSVNMTTGTGDAVPVYLRLSEVQDNTVKFITKTPVTLQCGNIITFTPAARFTDVLCMIVDSNGVGVSEDIANLTELVVDTTEMGKVQTAKVSFTDCDKNKITAVAEVEFNENIREQSFEKATIESTLKILYSDGQVGYVTVELAFDRVEDDTTAIFSAIVDIPDDAEGLELILSDTITPSNTCNLYNINKTLSLNPQLPKTNKAKISKTKSIATAIISLNDNNKIDSLNDVVIGVTYPETITADNLEGITLSADVNGIDGVSNVLYKAKQIFNNNTLVFVPAENVEGEYSNIVELKITDAKLNFAENSYVYSVKTGFNVDLAIEDATATFYTAVSEDSDLPTTSDDESSSESSEMTSTDESSSESSEMTSTDESNSENSEITEPSEQASENSPQDTNSTDSEPNNDDNTLTTGVNAPIMLIVLIMLIAFAVIIVLRKNKEQV